MLQRKIDIYLSNSRNELHVVKYALKTSFEMANSRKMITSPKFNL